MDNFAGVTAGPACPQLVLNRCTSFAGRDHTTVLHACRQIRSLMETDGKMREDWDKLIRKLSE